MRMVSPPLLTSQPGVECPSVDQRAEVPGNWWVSLPAPIAAASCWLPAPVPAEGHSGEVAGSHWGPGLPLSPQRQALLPESCWHRPQGM